jgi:hypothetical protein
MTTSRLSAFGLFAVGLLLAFAAPEALAQAATGDAGKSLWDTIINFLYGWPGAIIGLGIFFLVVWLAIKEGMMMAMGVGAVCLILFFAPAIVKWMQGEGQKTSPTAPSVKTN